MRDRGNREDNALIVSSLITSPRGVIIIKAGIEKLDIHRYVEGYWRYLSSYLIFMEPRYLTKQKLERGQEISSWKSSQCQTSPVLTLVPCQMLRKCRCDYGSEWFPT